MINRWQIVIPFNARWEDGCDYAQQTIRLTAKHNDVVAVPLAHEQSIWQAATSVWHGSIFTQFYQAAVFTPIIFLPFRSIAVLKSLNILLNAVILRLILMSSSGTNTKKGRHKQLVWFFEPAHISIWLQVFAGWNSLYDCVDYWLGFPGHIQKAHSWLVQRATWMVVNSKALLEATLLQRQDVTQVPLGFASEEFTQTNSVSTKAKTVSAQFTAIKQVRSPGRKVFGFVGQIGNRFDFPWLLQVMQAFPEHVFVFVGAIWAWKELDDTNLADQIATLQKQPNYLHIPSVPKAQIPLLVNQFDFGLIPYTTNQVFNKNCHPMKLYEYWWFGKPVVATAIYELSRYQYGICSTDSAVSAIKWIKKMLNGDHLHRLKQKTRQIARDNSWQAKLTAISNVVSS